MSHVVGLRGLQSQGIHDTVTLPGARSCLLRHERINHQSGRRYSWPGFKHQALDVLDSWCGQGAKVRAYDEAGVAERKLTASSVELTVAPFPGLGEAMDRTQAADGFGLSIDDEGGRVAILPVWAEHNDPNFKDDLRVWVKREGWDSFVECVRLGACGTWDELISASLDPSPENTVTASAEITVKPWTWRQKIRLALRRLADGQATLRRIL